MGQPTADAVAGAALVGIDGEGRGRDGTPLAASQVVVQRGKEGREGAPPKAVSPWEEH